MFPRLALGRLLPAVPFVVAAGMAAVLFPVFARARENARRSSCQNNLKQVGLSLMMYRQDYDDRFPPARNARTGQGWTEVLLPYQGSLLAFRCPNVTTEPSAPAYNDAISTDYFFNNRLAAIPTINGQTTIQSTSTLITLGDGPAGQNTSSLWYSIGALPPVWISSEDSPAKRHLNGANYAFADGHVKWLLPTRISTISNARTVEEFTLTP